MGVEQTSCPTWVDCREELSDTIGQGTHTHTHTHTQIIQSMVTQGHLASLLENICHSQEAHS